jgi:DNA mismatch endonuclease (patch repair protein)
LLLRKALHAQGARFRLNVRLTAGCTPDILMPRRRLAVFVDGCYWHSCPKHGRKKPWTGPNAALWEEKMRRNRERDLRATALAEERGWKVVRIWECEVRKSPHDAAAAVLAAAAS